MQKLSWEGFFGARLWMTLKATCGASDFALQSMQYGEQVRGDGRRGDQSGDYYDPTLKDREAQLRERLSSFHKVGIACDD